jgi:benzoylformate decarboxylase
MPDRRGVDVLLDVLESERVVHLFGNPGTTELPLIDALAERPEFDYVLSLQEATVVAMADGYAQATGRPAFVNLHTSAGLGNAIGNLTNARANGTPLVVTAGNADRRHLVADPLLSGDLVGLARGTVKWGHETRHPEELGTIVRRAFRDAATPPGGPVFVSMPCDVLEAPTAAVAPPLSPIARASVAGGLDELASLLASVPPAEVALVAGEEVASSRAVAEMVVLAETLGCAVWGAPLYSALVFPPGHPQWAGALPPRADAIRASLAPYRVVFQVGGQAFLVYPYADGSPLPDHTALVHLSADPLAPGHTHPVRLGLVGDPPATLAALLPLLAARVDADAVASARQEMAAHSASATAKFEELAESRYGVSPMHPMAAVHALLRALPPDSTVVDEAITAGSYVRGMHRPASPGTYFFCRGGGLGWGMPAAVGVSLARSGEPVLCVVGDGSAMYSPQALWTAASRQLPVLFAIVNNREYAILKQNLPPHGASARSGRTVGLDIDGPPIDYVALARAMGVPALTVEKAPDIGDAVRSAWHSGGPFVLELPVSPP